MILAEDLRKAVLQAAIQGKLVDQRPEEGTGEEFYARIQAAKAELIKRGIVKKEKPLPVIATDEIPFDIPENWIWVKLGNLTSKIGAGSTPLGGAKAGVYTDSGIPFIREMNVHDDGIHQEGMVFISQELSDSRENSKFYAGDLLLNITGGSIGRCAVVPPEMPIGDVNQHVEIIRLVDNSMKDYVHVLLRTPFVQSIINCRSVGDKAGFSATKCKNIEVPLPPLSEQIRIVTKLKEILDVLDSYECDEKQIVALQSSFPDDMRKSILQYAMQGKLVEQRPEEGTGEELYQQIQAEKDVLIRAGKIKREASLPEITDEETPFDIPESWKWVRFGKLCELISGSDLKPERYNDKGQGIPYITGASNIDDDGSLIINRWVLVPNNIAVRGDLLITCKGTVGKMAVLQEEQAHIARQIMAVRVFAEMSRDYIQLCLMNYVSLLNRKAKSMIPGIDRNNVLKLLIPLPPIQEQKRIVEKLAQILPHIEDLKEVQ